MPDYMDENMNDRIDGCYIWIMNGWIDENKLEWINKRLNGLMNGWKNIWYEE